MSYALSIIFGGIFIQNGDMTIGNLVTFFSYIGLMRWPMMAVGRLMNTLERGSASYNRIDELLKEKSSIVEKEGAIAAPLTGDLTVDLEAFKYPGVAQNTLHDIHFTVKQGETLGIVGRTGSGKSTLFELLLRTYDHYDGSIKYNGIDIRDYKLDQLLEGIGYVPQENFLFSTNIRENIRFANPAYTQEQIEDAARITAIHDDILGFPNGYDTLVGERGVSLSGGQKQRISIARAVITNPELLIFDDSLSAVDAKTEEEILSNMNQKRHNRTTIISAHRISSVMNANEIIVLDEGTIIERGTHEQLMANNGWYSQMYEKQQLESKLEGDY